MCSLAEMLLVYVVFKNSLYHFTKNDENSNVFILSFYLKLTAHTYLYPQTCFSNIFHKRC